MLTNFIGPNREYRSDLGGFESPFEVPKPAISTENFVSLLSVLSAIEGRVRDRLSQKLNDHSVTNLGSILRL